MTRYMNTETVKKRQEKTQNYNIITLIRHLHMRTRFVRR